MLDLSKHRILVVEDEALIAFEVEDIIKKLAAPWQALSRRSTKLCG